MVATSWVWKCSKTLKLKLCPRRLLKGTSLLLCWTPKPSFSIAMLPALQVASIISHNSKKRKGEHKDRDEETQAILELLVKTALAHVVALNESPPWDCPFSGAVVVWSNFLWSPKNNLKCHTMNSNLNLNMFNVARLVNHKSMFSRSMSCNKSTCSAMWTKNLTSQQASKAERIMSLQRWIKIT